MVKSLIRLHFCGVATKRFNVFCHPLQSQSLISQAEVGRAIVGQLFAG